MAAVTSAELTNIVGYPTIGIIFGTALFGMALAQMLYYMSNYPKDPLWLKGLVAAIWSADVLKEITCVMMLWSLLAKHHADPLALASVPTPYIIEQIVDFVESSAVQCYYIYIGWKVGTHKWWNCLLFFLAILMSITSVACVSAAMYYLDIEDTSALASLGKVTVATNVISLITDLYITISLCIIFQSVKMPIEPSIIQSKSGRSESILSKLTRYTANRGIILWYVSVLHDQSAMIHSM